MAAELWALITISVLTEWSTEVCCGEEQISCRLACLGGVAPLEIVWCTTWMTMGSDCESLVSVALWEQALKWVLNR